MVAHRMNTVSIGLVTVSDRASRGEYEDRSGPAMHDYFSALVTSPWKAERRVIPDEQGQIEATLRELADITGCALIVTSGGTGPAPRDVTPEATMAVCDKLLPGFGEIMRRVSLEKVPTAILSRQTAGIRGSSLLINLPGSPKAIAECLDAVMPAVPDCLHLIGAGELTLDESRITVYNPHK